MRHDITLEAAQQIDGCVAVDAGIDDINTVSVNLSGSGDLELSLVGPAICNPHWVNPLDSFPSVVDPLFGAPAAAALRALRPHGRLVNLGGSAGETAPIDSSTLRSRSLRVLGYTNNDLTPDQRARALTHVVGEVLAGRLTAAHEPVPLVDVTGMWDHPGDRVVLVP